MRRSLFTLVGLLMLSGCQYYGVQDTATGRRYVTNNWQMSENSWRGTLKLTDSRTGEEVRLRQNYNKVPLSELETVEELRGPAEY